MDFTPQEKIERLESIVADDPNDHLGYFMLAKMYLDERRYLDAAAAYERCLELRPDYSAAWRFCGDSYRLAGDVAKARDVYTRGIAVAEENRDLQTVKEMKLFLRKLDE